MKKLFSSIVFAVVVMMGFAQVKQDTSQHLTFKGVPLNGTLNDFVLKMKKSGFIHLSTKDGTAILKGDFAGYKNCYVGVSIPKQKDLVNNIAVIFPSKDTWSTLSSNYFDLKNMLTEKYGKPSGVIEKFDSYSQPEDDFEKMLNVQIDKCIYYAFWETSKGDIHLSIAHKSLTDCYVSLLYSDKINGNIIKSSAKDDL